MNFGYFDAVDLMREMRAKKEELSKSYLKDGLSVQQRDELAGEICAYEDAYQLVKERIFN